MSATKSTSASVFLCYRPELAGNQGQWRASGSGPPVWCDVTGGNETFDIGSDNDRHWETRHHSSEATSPDPFSSCERTIDMVFPIGDDNSDLRIIPAVNYVLIALNVLVIVLFQGMGANDEFTCSFSTVPVEIRTGKDVVSDDRIVVDPATGRELMAPGLQPTPWSVYLTLLTSMFMHGGTAHLLGNMWFLWSFGDNVEDRMGHPRYLSFYLLTGLAASMSHVRMNLYGPGSMIPSLGASGAISGVMGAYLALCPNRRVRVVLLRIVTVIPGYMAVGLWFLFQLIRGIGSPGGGSQESGVADAAHIGGFVEGVFLAKPFVIGRPEANAGWFPAR
jgi:membrane associated rhomboid family serine protease